MLEGVLFTRNHSLEVEVHLGADFGEVLQHSESDWDTAMLGQH